ncbi:ISAs1 family transposase [Desulfococcaceae bacterium HSG7]|nr:ISAs1 family transposase [Desulfococcaceae bacterium HSG7]
MFKIKDHRRWQGRRYELGHILFFSVLAILSGADSYRKVQRFIVAHYSVFDKIFKLNWKKMPAHTTVRNIIRGTSASELEECFRQYSAFLADSHEENRFISSDGKVLRGSFDHLNDQKAIQILSAFLSNSHIIPATRPLPLRRMRFRQRKVLSKRQALAVIYSPSMPFIVRKRRSERPEKPAMMLLFR